MRISPLALLLILLVMAPPVAEAAEQPPLCNAARDTLSKDRALQEATTMAWGGSLPYLPETKVGEDEPDCDMPVALVRFPTADVLVTSHTGGGSIGHVTTAKLSAYVFRRRDGGTRKLATVRRDFGEGADGFGQPGQIQATHFGADDGLVVSGSYLAQGISVAAKDYYVFGKNGIRSLGFVRTGYSDGAYVDDETKATEITSRVEPGVPSSDKVTATYTTARGGKTVSQNTVVWVSRGGKFVVESGEVPKEIADDQ